MTPREGLAFLISAISAGRPRVWLRSMARMKPRGGGIERARDSISAGGTERLAAAISARLLSSICLRMSATQAPLLVGDRDQAVDALGGPAVGDDRRGERSAFADVVREAGHNQRRA